LSYQLTIFLKRIERRERLPRVLMSVYKGPSVAISGNMVFNGHNKNPVVLWVFTGKPETYKIAGTSWPFIIAAKKIPGPGCYEIRVPQKIGKVYITAQQDRPVFPCSADGSKYVGRAVNVGTQDIKGVDIKVINLRSQ
ncbi:MAG: hypothetical protein PHW54_04595, partial [Candidatus Omnitrophica bacterium]|nr:hypothetical protein [Candidatus Omnitrophota bacterium]